MAGGKSRRIVVRPRADQDLTEHAQYIARDNVEAGLRFYAAAEETFQALAALPKMGSARDYRNPRLTGLRMWRVKDFEKYLIFYRPMPSGIEVIRVLHGERDIEAILAEE
jgi:toxin ParE1/3/4